MVHQLLWVETLLKFAGGAVLVLMPVATSRLLGLPHGNTGLWARVAGFLLLGIAAAIYLEGLKLSQLKHGGLGIAGIAVINICAIFGLAAVLITGHVRSVRGRFAMWFLIAILTVLSVLEVAAS